MNQKKIDDMIHIALKVLRDESGMVKAMKDGDYEIKKVFFGYMAAFGPAVVQSGIAKTLAFYSKTIGESEEDRNIILDFIKQVFVLAYNNYASYNGADLLTIYDKEIQRLNFTTLNRLALADKILEATIACKLAMNTYHAKENPESEE
jgi:CRISPR/Cas system CMR-associated protein Cmr5 small subunit